MQFVAERRIENGLQIVTPFFLNSPNCLYIKKSCNLLQSYEKYLIYTSFLSAILTPKVLKINKLQRRLLRHLGTSNWTPYFRKIEIMNY